jgi:hypothetical protein
MDAEHKRPLAAFVAVSATGALLLGQSLVTQPDPSDANRSTGSQATSEPTTSSAPSGSPSNGKAVAGITAAPTYLPVKSIGSAPKLMARDDDGLEVTVGAVRDPEGKPDLTGAVRTKDKDDQSPGPPDAGPSETPEPEPSESPEPSRGPKPDFDDFRPPGSSGSHFPGSKDDSGPGDDDGLPEPQEQGAHRIAPAQPSLLADLTTSSSPFG